MGIRDKMSERISAPASHGWCAVVGFFALVLTSAFVGRAHAETDLEALIKAAKAEGELVLYSAPTENVARKVSAAFTAKYDIKVNVLRLASATLESRYSAEAQTGSPVADVVWIYGSTKSFVDPSASKGWFDSIEKAELPVVKSGEFPKDLNYGNAVLVQATPWGMAYNTEKVTAASAPKTYLDLLDPRYKGQILVPDPRVSDAYVGFWAFILDRHGEGFFERLRAQDLRLYQSGVPAIQALAAGEGFVFVPVLSATTAIVQSKGASVAMFIPPLTTGSEAKMVLTARKLAKHPNAARLFANYVMSKEGNAVFNSEKGDVSIYDTQGMPAEYKAPTQDFDPYRARIIKLLGL